MKKEVFFSMKKLLIMALAILACSQSLEAKKKDKDKAWIVNTLPDWKVTVSLPGKKEEVISVNTPLQANVGNKDCHVTIWQKADCGINECFKQGRATTRMGQKGVYEISNPVKTSIIRWTGTKDVLVYNVNFARLDDALAASKYPDLKY